jgi:hypothetical protein
MSEKLRKQASTIFSSPTYPSCDIEEDLISFVVLTDCSEKTPLHHVLVNSCKID